MFLTWLSSIQHLIRWLIDPRNLVLSVERGARLSLTFLAIYYQGSNPFVICLGILAFVPSFIRSWIVIMMLSVCSNRLGEIRLINSFLRFANPRIKIIHLVARSSSNVLQWATILFITNPSIISPPVLIVFSTASFVIEVIDIGLDLAKSSETGR